ncbi:MAG: 4-(cytidine 5'-diphospho)-2-C-methyl-D-erythritol kinase [Isosphaeraceae bacterium]
MRIRSLADGVECLAPAKLNLFLEVLGKRPDSYHEIETLMVAVDLFDTLHVKDDSSGRITLRCDDPTLPTGSENLVVRAAERLKAEVGGCRGATITLSKSIPAQAGLAGGSSDAAATLAALNQLWNLKVPEDRLDALAGEIGSDVAFFRHGPAAVCRGRGEQVQNVHLTAPLHFVLVCPLKGVSTANVYRQLTPPDRPGSIEPVLEALALGDTQALGRSLFNRLQPVAETLEPSLVRVRKALTTLGSLLDGHLMSGSGSAYFGLCRDFDAAGHAARQLATLGPGTVRVVTCGP